VYLLLKLKNKEKIMDNYKPDWDFHRSCELERVLDNIEKAREIFSRLGGELVDADAVEFIEIYDEADFMLEHGILRLARIIHESELSRMPSIYIPTP
jgi:hypothetical protein